MSKIWYLEPYYLLNSVLCVIYPIMRLIGLHSKNLLATDTWGFNRESQVIGGIATLIIIKFLRYYTNFKKFLNDAFFYLKCATVILLFVIDKKLAVWYIFLCTGKFYFNFSNLDFV